MLCRSAARLSVLRAHAAGPRARVQRDGHTPCTAQSGEHAQPPRSRGSSAGRNRLSSSPIAARPRRFIMFQRRQRLTNRFRAEFREDRFQGADALGELIAGSLSPDGNPGFSAKRESPARRFIAKNRIVSRLLSRGTPIAE